MGYLKKGEKTIVELIKDYKNGDIEARNIIFNRYLHYVDEIVEEYKGLGLSDEDLYQSGCEGLLIAIEKYTGLSPFSMIFIPSIHHTILNEIKNSKGISLDKSKFKNETIDNIKLLKRIPDILNEYYQTYGSLPKPEEIASILGIPEEKVLEIISDWNLIENIKPNIINNYGYTHGQNAQNGEDELIYKDLQNAILRTFQHAKLSERNQEILLKYFNSTEDVTLEQLSKEYNVTIERIREIKVAAIVRLRKYRLLLMPYLEFIEEYTNDAKELQKL